MIEPKAPGAKCDECPLADRPPVYGTGPDKASLVIVGEAPGEDEVKTGQPFTGKSGKLLDKVLDYHGLKREEIWFTNACLCRPEGNATPNAKAIKACRDRRITEIRLREPRTILALGAVAAKSTLNDSASISQIRTRPGLENIRELPRVRIVATFHPAAALYSPSHFPSILNDVGKINGVKIGWEPTKYKVVSDVQEAIRTLQAQAGHSRQLALDVETDHKTGTKHNPDWLCIGISHRPGGAVVYSKQIVDNPLFQSILAEQLARIDLKWAYQLGKFDIQNLWIFAPEARVDKDSLLSSYAVDERTVGIHDLETLATERLGAPFYKTETKQYLPQKGASLAALPPKILHRYNAYDVDNTHRLIEPLEKEMAEDDVTWVYENLLIPGANALARMEYGGFAIDVPYLEQLSVELEQDADAKDQELQQWVKNPRSPIQVKAALHELGYEVESTNKNVIKDIDHEFTEGILAYRKVHKLLTTYVRGLMRRTEEGRIYARFELHTTETGRLSSRDPNLQNIPIGSKIRNAFTASPGRVLLAADYKAIELRLMALFAGDRYLLQAFAEGRNLHKELATALWGDYSEQQYVWAKNVRFGSLYKGSADYLGHLYDIPTYTARKIQDEMFRQSPAIKQYWKTVEKEIAAKSYLESFFGRKRRFWLITRENWHDIVKEGINFMVQSPASDITLRALIQLEPMLRGVANPVDIVHDNIVFDVLEDRVEEVAVTVRDVMEDNPEFDVPLPVEFKLGRRWGSLKEYELD